VFKCLIRRVGPNGEILILSKNNGLGNIVSAFQSRELCWGMVKKESIQHINEKRRDETYFDREVSKAVNDSKLKMELIESPLVRTFDYRSFKGCWMGNHKILLVEDITDCLKTNLGNGFEYRYLFDHSTGHAKKPDNGLDVKKMNVGWGWQSVVRNSII
jgi:hypothetical protein